MEDFDKMERFLPLPHSWSELTWQQLCNCWQVKLSFGSNPDAARAAALLKLLGLEVECLSNRQTPTGEDRYILMGDSGRSCAVTPRELAWMSKQALPWYDYPYGDPGEKEERDEHGKVVKEARTPTSGYVGPMLDALALPETELQVDGTWFALPQVACNNITWQQYRSLQPLVPQLFQEGRTEAQVLDLQAQFLAHILVPDLPAGSSSASADRFRPSRTYRYVAERAEQTVPFWKERLTATPTLFHICFQVYHTAVLYYEKAYPLLFGGSSKSNEYTDALKGEIGTLNAVMKYQGYSNPQQVYDANLPIVLDTLDTIAKEAKEVEKMNAKIKKK